MSKLSNLLNMYMLLQGRELLKIKELAEILEVSPRMIKEYKNDLEKAGIYIGSKRGRYGGYYLENRMDLKGLSITKDEIESLKMANEIIKSGDYIFSLDFEILTNKIINHKNDFDNVDFFTKDNLRPESMKEKEKENWNIIKKAIINRRKVEIIYNAIRYEEDKPERSIRIVHPYGTFNHDGAGYLFGYCELRKGVRYFKLSRIESLIILDDKFSINKEYDIKSILSKSFGIIDDEIFYLKLRIYYPMSKIVKEKQFSINQTITEIDENTIIFEANIKGYNEVKMWVLSMGRLVEVLEPRSLRSDIYDEAQKLKQIYE